MLSRLRARDARLGAALLYLLTAFAVTFPVWRHPATTWTGSPGDPMKFMEFFAWYPFAILHHVNPLLNSYVNLPAGSNMMWDTTMPLPSVVLWPVTATFGVIASWNMAVLAALTLDGWCTFLWLRRHVAHGISAWAGGLMMVLGPYASSRAHAHLDLLLFFPVPLIFVQVEDIIQRRGRGARRSGVLLGVLAAAQLLFSEEVLALLAVMAATVAAFGVLIDRSWLRRTRRDLEMAAVPAALAFLAIAGIPVIYQLFGPDRIVGPVQPTDTYVTSLVNLVIPSSFAAIDPHFAYTISQRWIGGAIENNSYVGLPLLAITGWSLSRWRRDSWARLVGIGTLAAFIWSLGPDLHLNGFQPTSIPLPGTALAGLPIVDNILPVRFDLFVDLGLAAIIALFADRAVVMGHLKTRLIASGLLALACLTLLPSLPIATYRPNTPRYFFPRGDVHELPSGTVALVVPYGDSELTMAPMLWQAESDFHFRMVSGAMFTAGPRGISSFGQSRGSAALDCLMYDIQYDNLRSKCSSEPVLAMRSGLATLGVTVMIMGPMSYTGQTTNRNVVNALRTLLSVVAGRAPLDEEGVLVWSVRTPNALASLIRPRTLSRGAPTLSDGRRKSNTSKEPFVKTSTDGPSARHVTLSKPALRAQDLSRVHEPRPNGTLEHRVKVLGLLSLENMGSWL